MNKQITKLFIAILSSIFLFSSLAVAGGQFKGKNKSQPPGWEQGEKKGWKEEATPPGLTEEKMQKKQKAGMKGDESKAKAQDEVEKAKQESELKEEKAEQEVELKEEKAKQEAELKEEKAKQEAEIQKQKKKQQTKMKDEQEKIKSMSKKKKG